MTTPAPRQPASRRTREAAVAVVLLPVLLLLGILLGTKVLGGDGDSAETVASATRSPGGLLVGPKLATGSAAAPTAPGAASATTTKAAPTTAAPITAAPTTAAPTAAAPTTAAPTAAAPTTAAPRTAAPTTAAPTTAAPTTAAPTTAAPTATTSPRPSASATPAPSAGSSAGSDDEDSGSTASSPPKTLHRVLGPGSAGSDVRAWQAKMSQRGWIIRVDGVYGSQTASVAQRFQVEKRLPVDGLVGSRTYRAAWSLAVT